MATIPATGEWGDPSDVYYHSKKEVIEANEVWPHEQMKHTQVENTTDYEVTKVSCDLKRAHRVS